MFYISLWHSVRYCLEKWTPKQQWALENQVLNVLCNSHWVTQLATFLIDWLTLVIYHKRFFRIDIILLHHLQIQCLTQKKLQHYTVVFPILTIIHWRCIHSNHHHHPQMMNRWKSHTIFKSYCIHNEVHTAYRHLNYCMAYSHRPAVVLKVVVLHTHLVHHTHTQ